MTRLKRKKEVANATERTTRHDVRFGTPELVAQYRAERLAPGHDTVIEVGAGAGFQTAAFAKLVKKVIAVDIDAERLSRAKFPENVVAIAGDALSGDVLERVRKEVVGDAVVFLDPQRPAQSPRRTLSEIRPDINLFLDAYAKITPRIAIELPPFLDASEVPKWAQREYLSIDGQLNRLTAYFGPLKRCDVAVVRLPGGERVEHQGRLPGMRENLDPKMASFILEPDVALSHAGLEPLALPAHYRRFPMGKKLAFLTSKRSASPFFRVYKIVAQGEDGVRRALLKRPPQAVILHGQFSPQEQKALLEQYRPQRKGKDRVHVFIGRTKYLAIRE